MRRFARGRAGSGGRRLSTGGAPPFAATATLLNTPTEATAATYTTSPVDLLAGDLLIADIFQWAPSGQSAPAPTVADGAGLTWAAVTSQGYGVANRFRVSSTWAAVPAAVDDETFGFAVAATDLTVVAITAWRSNRQGPMRALSLTPAVSPGTSPWTIATAGHADAAAGHAAFAHNNAMTYTPEAGWDTVVLLSPSVRRAIVVANNEADASCTMAMSNTSANAAIVYELAPPT